MFLRHLKEIGYGVEIKMATTGATFTYVANCFGKWRFKRLRKIYRGSVGISTKKNQAMVDNWSGGLNVYGGYLIPEKGAW